MNTKCIFLGFHCWERQSFRGTHVKSVFSTYFRTTDFQKTEWSMGVPLYWMKPILDSVFHIEEESCLQLTRCNVGFNLCSSPAKIEKGFRYISSPAFETIRTQISHLMKWNVSFHPGFKSTQVHAMRKPVFHSVFETALDRGFTTHQVKRAFPSFSSVNPSTSFLNLRKTRFLGLLVKLCFHLI